MAEENNQDAAAEKAGTVVETQDNAANAAGSENVDKQKVVTDNSTGNESAFDPRISYDNLHNELQSVSKSYKELQREFTRRNQDSSELKKQLETLHKAFTEATKEEISPAEFMKSLQTQGIKAFDPLRQEWTKGIKDEYTKQLEERDNQVLQLRDSFARMKRELDTVNYPDFVKLKPKMNEIANSDNCPIDWSQDLDVIYDTLYKLAKDGSAENAVKKAREIGKKEADAQAAKDAATAVAGGGKTAGNTNADLSKITDITKLRQMVASMHGVADR